MGTGASKTAIIIVGPTASGKTAVSLELAAKYSTFIISADSRQCYRELNIGVAKPSPDELAKCRHYFIDTNSIHDPVNTVVFEREAIAAVGEIFTDADVAVVTGGTGLYVQVFCNGIDDMPAVDPEIKKKIDEAWITGGIIALQKWLNEVDPLYLAQTKEAENRVRLMRALEIKLSSGLSILEFRRGDKKARDFQIRKIGIDWSRDLLYARINKRVDDMIEAGLFEEVRTLYPYKNLKALQTVGYQELFEHMDGKYSFEEAIDKIKQHTRNYAKRQMTWFRKDKNVEWMSWKLASRLKF